MTADAAQEDGLSVEQDVASFHTDFPEADLVADFVAAAGQDHVIKLRIFRRPELRRGFEDSLAFSAADPDFLPDAQLIDPQNGGLLRGIRKLHAHTDFAEIRSRHQCDPETLYKQSRHPYQLNIPVDAAVVEPVGVLCRNLLRPARGVSLDDNPVFFLQRVGDLEISRCRAAPVHAQILFVQKDAADVIYAAQL